MAIQYLAANRFGLGRRWDDPAIHDPRAWLLRQLADFDPAPPPIAALEGRAAIATAYIEYREDRRAMRREAAEAAPMSEEEKGMDPELRRLARSAIRRHYVDGVAARLTTAVASPTPFAERLTHFWSNHFAVSADKIAVIGFTGNYEFEAIRPHITGKFADLLIAAVRHPAMLLYLDQAQSFGPDSPVATRIRRRQNRPGPGLNENLAREILELHTLGVRTGYTQADVTAFAKALTGLTVAGLGRGAGQRLMPAGAAPGETVFIPQLHQPGEQTILGKRYADGGAKQAEAVLRDLAVHPATAQHIATKLARHFTADDPPPAGRAAVGRFPEERRRPPLALPHPRRLARAVAGGARDVQVAVGLDGVADARAQAPRARRAAEYRRALRSARPAGVATGIARGL